jgi:hypothetical protein
VLDQDLGDERAARHARQEHVDRPLVPHPVPRHQLSHSVRDVALLARRPEGLAAHHLEPEGDHARHDVAHVRGIEAGGNGQELAAVGDDGGVVRIHGRHGGDAERAGHAAGQRAAQAVAARVEGGSGQQQAGLVALQRLPDARADRFLALRDVVVAAHERGDDRSLGPQRLLERPARPDRPFAHLERSLRPLLAPDAAEELVQVVHYADWLSHGPLRPPCQRAATVPGIVPRRA